MDPYRTTARQIARRLIAECLASDLSAYGITDAQEAEGVKVALRKLSSDIAPHRRLSVLERFLSHVEKAPNGCWLWTGSCRKGYGRFTLRHGTQVPAHRYSYEHYHGRDPGNLLVLHSCDTPTCVNPDHLSLGTNWDNAQDRVCKQRYSKTGYNAPKLKADQVVAIRIALRDYRPGLLAALARQYNVYPATIAAIKRGVTYKHVV